MSPRYLIPLYCLSLTPCPVTPVTLSGKHANLADLVRRVGELPNIKKWVETRPKSVI